jgi:MoxR-like ATPase
MGRQHEHHGPAHQHDQSCRHRTSGRAGVDHGDRIVSSIETLSTVTRRVIDNIENVIEGKRDVIRTALTVLLAEGHLLIEDVPGVGKTMLAKALARSVDCTVKRIQFTPDLLP